MNQKDIVLASFDPWFIRSFLDTPIICIYKHPVDYPDKYVARLGDANSHTNLIALADTLDSIRQTIPKGMCAFERSPQDDPCIVETWI